MNFGEAIELMKQGYCVRRAGWNGKNMHVYLESDLRVAFPPKKGERGFSRDYKPVFCLFNAQAEHQPGWVPSQADMLAEDWEKRT